MTLYLAVVEDRHSDTSIYVFDALQAAIDHARACAKEYNRFPEDYQEEDLHLFFARYSCEGDCAYVISRTLNDTSG